MADFTVALDCMGGDNAPEEPVKGAIDALKKDKEKYLKNVAESKLGNNQ